MEKQINFENLGKKLRDLYIQRYNALYIENNHVKGNQLELKFTKIEEKLIISNYGIFVFKKMLFDENEIVRYYVASALISLFPKECIKVLNDVEKGNTFLASNVKYVIKNYKEDNNYFQKFLEKNHK